jgi:hypothetical protein
MKVLIAVLILLTLSMPMGVNALTPPQAQTQALFLSSLNATQPMGYYSTSIMSSLKRTGYNAMYLTDGAVTIDLLLTKMKNYSVVIWRTDSFTWNGVTYWYVGEKANIGVRQKYASDFAAGNITINSGIVAVSTDFLKDHFGPNTLSGVKLLIFLSSNGNTIAPVFLAAGVMSVVFCIGDITLQFGFVDDLTAELVSYLTQGEDVHNAVYDTVSPFNQGVQPNDPLDSTYAPIFWYIGDGTVAITSAIHSAPSLRIPRLP